MRAEYIDTKENAADVLTKGLGTDSHRKHTDTLSGLDWNADQDLIYQESLAPEQRSEYAAKYLGTTSLPSQTEKKYDVANSERSCINAGLDSKDMEVLTIDKTIWLKIMKTVRETKESLQTRDYERFGKSSTPVVEIKGVRETYTPMWELD